MPRVAASELAAYGARVYVQLIVDHDQVIRGHLVGGHEGLHRAAAGVHVALGLGQHQLLTPVRALAHQRPALGLPVAHADLLRYLVHGIEAGVMTGMGVFFARITQACDQEQGYSPISNRPEMDLPS